MQFGMEFEEKLQDIFFTVPNAVTLHSLHPLQPIFVGLLEYPLARTSHLLLHVSVDHLTLSWSQINCYFC